MFIKTWNQSSVWYCNEIDILQISVIHINISFKHSKSLVSKMKGNFIWKLNVSLRMQQKLVQVATQKWRETTKNIYNTKSYGWKKYKGMEISLSIGKRRFCTASLSVHTHTAEKKVKLHLLLLQKAWFGTRKFSGEIFKSLEQYKLLQSFN